VEFYLAALAPLGYMRLKTFGPNGEVVGQGVDNKPDWWLTATPDAPAKLNLHLAFTAKDTFHNLATTIPTAYLCLPFRRIVAR